MMERQKKLAQEHVLLNRPHGRALDFWFRVFFREKPVSTFSRYALMLVAIVAYGCSSALAEESTWLKRQYAKAKSGDIIDIPAGHYDLRDWKISKNITFRGAPEGGTVFLSAEVTEKGVLIPQANVSLRVENITFKNITAWSKNGAGIRHEGRDLIVVNCTFDSTEDGILATGDPNGVITIRGSKFIDNGFGDGQSHAIYISSGAKLDVDGSYFIGTRIGHHVKSLADNTLVTNSHLEDGFGRSSYAVDASKGGHVTLEGNTIIQAANADNYSIINYDTTRGGKPGNIRIVGNKIINHFDGGVFLRNDTKSPPVMGNNSFKNTGKKELRVTSRGSPAPTLPN